MVDAALSQKQAEIHRPPCLIEEGWFHEAQWMKEGSWRPSTRANSLRRRRWLTRQTESLVTWQCMQNMGCCGQAWAGVRRTSGATVTEPFPEPPPPKKKKRKHTKQPTQTRPGRRTEKGSTGGGGGGGGEKQRQARKKEGRRKREQKKKGRGTGKAKGRPGPQKQGHPERREEKKSWDAERREVSLAH